MRDYLYAESEIFPEIFVSVFLGLVGLQLFLRVFGKRSFAKIDGIDFATTIAIGSVLASLIVSTNVSITRGLVAIVAILLFQTVILWLYNTFPSLKKLCTNEPVFLIREGKIQDHNLKKSRLTKNNLMESLRKSGVNSVSDVHAAVFETTGDISIMSGKKVDPEVLKGVRN